MRGICSPDIKRVQQIFDKCYGLSVVRRKNVLPPCFSFLCPVLCILMRYEVRVLDLVQCGELVVVDGVNHALERLRR